MGWTLPSFPRNIFPRYSHQNLVGLGLPADRFFPWSIFLRYHLPILGPFSLPWFTFRLVSVGEAFGGRALPTISDRLWHVWLLSSALYQPRKKSHRSPKSTLKCATAIPLNGDPFSFKIDSEDECTAYTMCNYTKHKPYQPFSSTVIYCKTLLSHLQEADSSLFTLLLSLVDITINFSALWELFSTKNQ